MVACGSLDIAQMCSSRDAFVIRSGSILVVVEEVVVVVVVVVDC